MKDERLVLQGHLRDLASMADRSGTYRFSDFLGLGEQSAFREIERELSYIGIASYGGATGAERILLRFGDPEAFGYELPFPITALRIVPRSPKFAEALTHRDVLGSLMNLGITRDTLGDIIVRESEIFVFCLDSVANFIRESLTRIRHTDVKVSVAEQLPEGELYRCETVRIVASGERLDGIIAKVYHLSREEAQSYIHRSLVYQNGILVESASRLPREGDVISVRGLGRFRYVGIVCETKKGKHSITVEKFV